MTRLARIVEICRSAQDARTLRLDLLHELRSAVGFDSFAFLLTDPRTSVGVAPIADVPFLDQLPRLIRLKYLTPVNRWTALDDVALLTPDTRKQSPLWRELLSEHDVRDVASSVYRDRFGCWGFLDLWRSGRAEPFSAEDAAFLARIVEPVTQALRRCQARTFAAGAADAPRLTPLVILLSTELVVLGQTGATEDYLRLLVPAPPDRQPIPASAYNVAAQLLAVEEGVDDNPAVARVHLADGVWVTLRAGRLDSQQATIAVTIEETSPAERLDLFGRACGLSPRENELLGLLHAGADTRTIAQAMFLSEHTVQDHLKSIFAKTSTNTRRGLLARALR